MKRYRPLIITAGLMVLLSSVYSIDALARLLQIPSGWLASVFLGAPAALDGDLVRIFTTPPLTVSASCSGVRFFAFVAGLGGGYWCGTRPVRWMALLPLSYLIALFGNAARISMAWQFRRFSDGRIPEWLQEYVHMGIGIACFLTIVAVLLYWIHPQPRQDKETTP